MVQTFQQNSCLQNTALDLPQLENSFVGFHVYRVIYSLKVNFLKAIFFTKWRIQTFRMPNFYYNFEKSTACSMPVDVAKKGFIQSFYSLLWKNFNQSFFKNGHKTTHRFGQTSQNSPWILIISERWRFTFFFSKDLTCGFRQIKFGLFLPNTFVWIVFSLIFEKNLG